MSKMIKTLIGLAVLVGLLTLIPKLTFWKTPKAVSGISAPTYSKVSGQETLDVDGMKITLDKKYDYEACGIVRMIRKYDSKQPINQIFPVDMCLVWGSAAENNDKIDYEWMFIGNEVMWSISEKRGLEETIDLDAAVEDSVYINIIPRDDMILSQLKKVKMNDYVCVKGYLVDVNLPAGVDPEANKYLTRVNDSPLLYVTGVEWME